MMSPVSSEIYTLAIVGHKPKVFTTILFYLGTETHIANLVLTSKLTTSNFGDRRLFFRHQNMADDVILKPDWDPYLDKMTTSVQTCPGREPKK